uniref:Uncharacterized protein n=1 Tax=Cannabis sativa TaxID=3483 RepID=A0A803QDT4_CANSA
MPYDQPGTKEPEVPRRNNGNLEAQPRAHGSPLRDRHYSLQAPRKGARTNPNRGNEMNQTQGRRAGCEEARVTARCTVTHSRSMRGGENPRRNNDQKGKIQSMGETRSPSCHGVETPREQLERKNTIFANNLVQSKGNQSICE